jgi:hypothetical protein
MISRTSFGRRLVEQAQHHRVDRDGLAGAGRAGDQQMRHSREIATTGWPPMSLPSASVSGDLSSS